MAFRLVFNARNATEGIPYRARLCLSWNRETRFRRKAEEGAARLSHAGLYLSCVHVYSPTYRIAALGNITTDPQFRGRGYARIVAGSLCRHLLQSVEHVGLNVKSDNLPAIRCYQSLGFENCAEYEETMVEMMQEKCV